eukprot:gene3049-2031_t
MLVIHLTAFDLHGYVDLINVNATVCLCWVVNFVDFSSAKFNYLCVSLVVIFVDLFVTEWLLMGSLKCICGIIVLIWAFVTVYYCDYSFKVDDVVAGLFAVDLVLALCALCFLSCFPIYVACIAGVLMHYVMLCGFTIDFITGMFVSDANYGLLLHVIFGCFWVLWFMVLCDEFRFLLDTNEIVVLPCLIRICGCRFGRCYLVHWSQFVNWWGVGLFPFAEVICLCMDGLLIDSVVLLCRPGEFVCLKTYYLPLISSSLLFQVGCGLQWFSIVVSWFYGFYDGMLVFSDLGDRDAIKPFGSILMCVIMLVEYLVTVQRGFVLMVVDLLCLVVSGLLCCDGMGVVRCAVVRPYSLAELCRGFVCLAYHSLGELCILLLDCSEYLYGYGLLILGFINRLTCMDTRKGILCDVSDVACVGFMIIDFISNVCFSGVDVQFGLLWRLFTWFSFSGEVFGTFAGTLFVVFQPFCARLTKFMFYCGLCSRWFLIADRYALCVIAFRAAISYGSYSVWLCFRGCVKLLQCDFVVSYTSIYYSFCVLPVVYVRGFYFEVGGTLNFTFVGFGLLDGDYHRIAAPGVFGVVLSEPVGF